MELLWSTTTKNTRTVNADFSKYDKFLCFIHDGYSQNVLFPVLVFSKNVKYTNGGWYGNNWFSCTFTDSSATCNNYNGLDGFIQIWGLE